MKRLILTGIGGSIGCHTFAHIMTNTDWEVVGIDSFRHKGWTDRIVEMFDHHPEWQKRLTVITHDLVAPFSPIIKKNIGKVDYIINMASLSDVEASIVDPVPFVQNNVALMLNMLEFAREVEPEAFIQVSTDEVYGPTDGKDLQYKEGAPRVPSNPYAASKAMQEDACIAYWRAYNVPLIIINMMNNFGEMQQPSKYPVMIQKAIADGKEITIHGEAGDIGSRSYIHSRNSADAMLFLLNNVTPHIHVPGKVDEPDRFHIAGDRQLDNLELAQLIADLMGKELKYRLIDYHRTRSGHDKHYGLNDDKIKELGWKPPLTFEESLKNTIDWQQKNPRWINTE